MAEFRETFLTDPETPIALAQLANSKFGLTLSPYDPPEDVLRAILRAKSVTVSDAENFDSLFLKIINRVA